MEVNKTSKSGAVEVNKTSKSGVVGGGYIQEDDIEQMLRDTVERLAKEAMANLLAEASTEYCQDFTIRTTSNRLGAPKLEGDVGYDLPSVEEVIIPAGGFARIKTGVRVQIPEGFWGLITPRSGANNSGQIVCLPGVIDTGFRGELMAFVHNVSEQKYTVSMGKAVVQLVLFPVVTPPIKVVDELDDSERGMKGFGSTDTNK